MSANFNAAFIEVVRFNNFQNTIRNTQIIDGLQTFGIIDKFSDNCMIN